MSPAPWEVEAELALRSVSTAGELLADRPERVATDTKESLRDVVTEYDVRIERHLAAMLAPSGHPILGEETAGAAPAVPAGDRYWLVDPIDGTANFVTGLPYYGISVGLWAEGTFLLGAVSLPALKELFFTHGTQGAYLNGRALRPPPATLETALVAASFSGTARDPDRYRAQVELFGRVNQRSRGALRLGSAAVNICYVAAGRLQGAYGLDAQLWDVAGALAIARQAGCRVAFHRRAGSTRIDYVVGSAAVVDALRALGAEGRLLESVT